MPANKKPKRKVTKNGQHIPRVAMKLKLNPGGSLIGHVIEGASLPDKEMTDKIFGHLRNAIDKFFEYGDYDDFVTIVGAVEISEEIEKTGIVKDTDKIIPPTVKVVDAIYARFAQVADLTVSSEVWEPTLVTEEEKEQVELFFDLFKVQVSNLSVQEYTNVHIRIENKKVGSGVSKRK